MNAGKPGPSLITRLSLWLAIQGLFGAALLCGSVYFFVALSLEQRQDEILLDKEATIKHVLAEKRPKNIDTDLQHNLEDVLAGYDELSLVIVDENGRTFFKREGTRNDPRFIAHRRFPVSIALRDGSYIDAEAEMLFDFSQDDDLLDQLAWILTIAAALGTLLVSWTSVWLVRKGLSPLAALAAQTRQVSALDNHKRLDAAGQPQELVPLITQFNDLLERLAVSYGQMQAFNADVAHELNTPLATLISSSELALRKPRPVEELREVLGSNLEELQRMAGIVADMLFLSRADRGQGNARRVRVASLAQLAAEISDYYEALLQDKELHVAFDGDSPARVDIGLIRRAIANLVGNAVRYARAGTAIRIRIFSSASAAGIPAGPCVTLLVSNEGDTIDPQHLPCLFDRFYRADASREHADLNHGMGLAIVAAIANMHGGETRAQSENGKTQIGFTIGE